MLFILSLLSVRLFMWQRIVHLTGAKQCNAPFSTATNNLPKSQLFFSDRKFFISFINFLAQLYLADFFFMAFHFCEVMCNDHTTPLGFSFEVSCSRQDLILFANVTKFDDNGSFFFIAWLANPVFCSYVVRRVSYVQILKKGFDQSTIILHFLHTKDDDAIPLALTEHPFRHLPKRPMITNGW